MSTLTGSQNADLAQAYVDFVLSADGTRALTAAGFQAP
jgi:ABC-type Fe3+ transport system substrate-binding protein